MNAQQELLHVLLKRLYTDGLLSESTYDKAEDLLHSVIEIPNLFAYTGGTKEVRIHEYPEDTQ